MATTFGGSKPKSIEQRTLDATQTSKYTFINKDFVKNMAFLNQTVDVHTAFLNKLQAGVSSANENVIEQIQGFAADLFLVFAGLEPTGIDMGDLKYVIQALGAMFGISPTTPFPLNIIDAVGHFFTSWVAPLSQFTDLIFDAIFAWAEDLGFSEDFLDAVRDFKDSIEALGTSFGLFFSRIRDLFDVFGIFGDPLGGLMGDIFDFFTDLVLPSLKPVLRAITDWTIPFINALSGTFYTLARLVNGIPIGHITNKDVNIVESGDFPDATVMETGDTWTWDSTQGRTKPGAARVNANSLLRQLESGKIDVVADQSLNLSVWVKWSSIVYTGTVPLGFYINRYNGDDLIATTIITAPTSPATNQPSWLELASTYTIPDDGTDSIAMSLRVNSNASNGTVWFDDVTLFKHKESMPQSWITNLIPDILGVNTFINNVIDAIISAVRKIPFVGGTISDLLEWLTGWRDDTDDTKTTANQAKSGMETTRDIVTTTAIGAASNIVITEPEDQDLADALSAQTNTIIQQSTAIQQLQQLNSGNAQAGNNSGTDFSLMTDSTSMGSSFDQYYSGPGVDLYGISDGVASVIPDATTPYNDDRTCLFVYKDESTLGDYQRVGAVFSSAPGKKNYANTNAYGKNHLRCRIAESGPYTGIDCVQVIFDIDSFDLGCVVNGTWTKWITVNHKFQNGSFYYIDAGSSGGIRQYRIYAGTTKLYTHNEVGTTSNLGSGYRKTGGGASWEVVHAVGGVKLVGLPGNISTFYMGDNAPAGKLLSIGRVFRTSSSYVNFATHATWYSVPTNFFDTFDFSTSDLSWNPTLSEWTVTKKGNYLINIQMTLDDVSKSGVIGLVINGTAASVGNSGTWSSISYIVPLEAGDIVGMRYQPFYDTAHVIGIASGTGTYFQVTRVSPNILEDIAA